MMESSTASRFGATLCFVVAAKQGKEKLMIRTAVIGRSQHGCRRRITFLFVVWMF